MYVFALNLLMHKDLFHLQKRMRTLRTWFSCNCILTLRLQVVPQQPEPVHDAPCNVFAFNPAAQPFVPGNVQLNAMSEFVQDLHDLWETGCVCLGG